MAGAWILAVVWLCSSFLAATAHAVQPHSAAGYGYGVLRDDGSRDGPCGYGNLVLNSDQQYENGYSWHYGGTQAPDWGSFAECFTPPQEWEVCAVSFDLTSVFDSGFGATLDAYLYDDDDGVPGQVLAVTTQFDPWPVARWPEVSRHAVPLVVVVDGPFWVGHWGAFQNITPPWFMAADIEGSAEGCAYTKIAPGIGYPSGWQHCEVVWGPTNALGIGYHGHRAGTSSSGGDFRSQVGSWGKIKALYR